MHKQSITVELDGKHYNVNTVSAGHHKMSGKEAVDRAKETGTLGRAFETSEEAEEFARQKSKTLGDKFPHPGDKLMKLVK